MKATNKRFATTLKWDSDFAITQKAMKMIHRWQHAGNNFVRYVSVPYLLQIVQDQHEL